MTFFFARIITSGYHRRVKTDCLTKFSRGESAVKELVLFLAVAEICSKEQIINFAESGAPRL